MTDTWLVSVTMDIGIASALRAVLRERSRALADNLRAQPSKTPLTLAEFETMNADKWPDDLRTVLAEQISRALAAVEEALAR